MDQNIAENLPEEVKKFLHDLSPNNPDLFQTKSIIRLNRNLLSYRTPEGLNLLMLASKHGNAKIVDFLLTSPFDVNFTVNEQTAIDFAWENQHEEIILKLLNANSIFPALFDADDASDSIKNFLQVCESMHGAIFCKNYQRIEEIIEENVHLRNFYERSNISAAAYAIHRKRFEAYKLLISKNVYIGPKEDVNALFSELHPERKTKIQKVHQNNAKELPQKYLQILIFNSRVGHDDPHVNARLNLIKEAFNILNKIPQIKLILQIVGASRNFQIFFDFNRDSVQHLDPTEDSSSNGVCYLSELIIVAAKDLLDPKTKFKAIGVLAHELCHFAMGLVFGNSGKSYSINGVDSENDFEEILMLCEINKDFEKIVEIVFSYKKILWHAELIVRVAHMLAQYFENDEKLQECRNNFPELFNYFDAFVVPAMESSLVMLIKLAEKPDQIEWKDLTQPMKAKVRNSEVNFQGMIVKFDELLSKDSATFENLKSNQICEIIKGNQIKIGEKFKLSSKFYIKRNFQQDNVNIHENFLKKIANDRIVLLSGSAGSGKTTTFENFTAKLKENFPNFWITFVDLKKHLSVYEECNNRIHEFNHIKVKTELLLKILKIPQNDFDGKMFAELFVQNKAIILWDGVDEIAPTYKHVIKILINNFRGTTSIQQWVSTRPQYSEELEISFKCKSFNFSKLSPSENVNFVKSFAENFPNKIEPNVIENIHEIIRRIEDQKHDINNPLMLKIITETFIHQNIPFDAFSLYSLYDKFIESKLKILNEKGEIVQSDRDKALVNRNNPIMKVHQAFGLATIMKDVNHKVLTDKDFNVSSLQICRTKINYKINELSRIGLLTFKDSNLEENITSVYNQNVKFDFLHQTIAEFFTAQYIIDEIYNMNDSICASEIEMRISLLFLIARGHCFYNIIHDFGIAYIDSENGDREYFNKYAKNLVITKYKDNFYTYRLSKDLSKSILFLSKFFAKDQQVLRVLWGFEETTTFMSRLALTYPDKWLENLAELKAIAEKTFEDENDLRRLHRGQNQKGIFLLCIWNSTNKDFIQNFENETGICLSEDEMRKFKEIDTIFDFYNYIENYLTQDEQKQLFYSYGMFIFSREFKKSDDFCELWEKMAKHLSKHEIRSRILFCMTDIDRGIILWNIMIYSPDSLEIVFEKLEIYLDKFEIKYLLMHKVISYDRSTFVHSFSMNNEKYLETLWKFIRKYLSINDQRKLLSSPDYQSMKPLQFSALSCNPKVFTMIKKIHEEIFTQKEIQEIVMCRLNRDETFLFAMIDIVTVEMCQEVCNFIDELFKNERGKLRKLLGCRDRLGDTIFSLFKHTNKEKLEIFKNLIKNEKNVEKLYENHKNLKGTLLFEAWQSQDQTFINEILSDEDFDEEIMVQLRSKETFLDFLKFSDEILTHEEQKRIFETFSEFIIEDFIKNQNNFDEIWQKVEKTCGITFVPCFVDKVFNINDENVSKITENEDFMENLCDKMKNAINSYFERFDSVNFTSETENFKFMLMNAAQFANEKFLELFWNFLKEKFNLNVMDFLFFEDKDHDTILKYSFYNKNRNSFIFIRNLYEKFPCEIICENFSKSTKRAKTFLFHAVQFSSIETCKETSKYLKSLFINKNDDLKNILKFKTKNNKTIFDLVDENEICKENLNLFIELAQEIFTKDEFIEIYDRNNSNVTKEQLNSLKSKVETKNLFNERLITFNEFMRAKIVCIRMQKF